MGAGLHCMEEGDGAVVVVVPGLFSTEVETGENILRFDHTTEFVNGERKEFVFEAESLPDVAAVIFVDNFDYSVDGVVVFLFVPQSGCDF